MADLSVLFHLVPHTTYYTSIDLVNIYLASKAVLLGLICFGRKLYTSISLSSSDQLPQYKQQLAQCSPHITRDDLGEDQRGLPSTDE